MCRRLTWCLIVGVRCRACGLRAFQTSHLCLSEPELELNIAPVQKRICSEDPVGSQDADADVIKAVTATADLMLAGAEHALYEPDNLAAVDLEALEILNDFRAVYIKTRRSILELKRKRKYDQQVRLANIKIAVQTGRE